MSENPYAPPKTEPEIVGILSNRPEDLRSVAFYQKGILICILIYLIAIFCQFLLPLALRPLLGLGFLGLGVVGTVFVFLLATKVYGIGVGIVLGILTLVPCLGLLVLLAIDGKATQILKNNGIRVGLLGADMSQL